MSLSAVNKRLSLNSRSSSSKKKKNSRKRGLTELDFNLNECPPTKRHRLNSKQINPNNIVENKENQNPFNRNNFGKPKLNRQETTNGFGQSDAADTSISAHLTVLSMHMTATTASNINDFKDESDQVSSSVDITDSMEVDVTVHSNNKFNSMNNSENDEEEDIDIEMFQEALKNTINNNKDKMNIDFEAKATALGNKAKHNVDYSPRFQRSGLLFLVQCGLGLER